MKIAIIRPHQLRNYRRIEEKAKWLSKKGHIVFIYGWNRYKDSSYNPKEFTAKRMELNASERSYKYFLFLPLWWLWTYLKLLKIKPDIVWGFNADSVIPVILYSKFFHRKSVIEYADFYSSIFENYPWPLPYIIKKIETFGMLNSDIIIVTSNDIIREFCNNEKMPKYYAFPNVLSEDEIKYIDSQKKCRYKTFTTCSIGAIESSRSPINVINAISDIEDCKLIFGGFVNEPKLFKKIKKMVKNQKNIEYVGYLSRNIVLEETKKSHLVVLLLDPDIFNHKYSLPNKLFESIFCSTPILTIKGTLTSEIVDKYNCGISISNPHKENIISAITKLIHNDKLWETLSYNCKIARYQINEKYNFSKIMEKISYDLK